MSKRNIESIQTYVCIILGSLIAAINIRTFVGSAHLFPGGFTGVSILIQRVAMQFFNVEVPFSFLNIGLNLIPAYISYRFVGKKFTIYSCIAIILTSIFVDMLPFVKVPGDMMLLSIFGGIINGVSILIFLKGSLSSGGTDFLAMSVSNKYNISTWNYVLVFNGIIILMSGFLFHWNIALYSIIFQFCSIQMINTFHKRYKKVCLFIISARHREISDALISDVNHGVTRFTGIGCYSNNERNMLYTVVSAEQMKIVKRIIKEIDSCAFVNAVKSEQINGLFHIDPFE